MILKTTSMNYWNNAFYGKAMENVRNRLKNRFIERENVDTVIKQQPKINFSWTHKSYTNYDSNTFKQNEVLLDEPNYLGFAVLELGKMLMYET